MALSTYTVETDLNECTWGAHVDVAEGKARLSHRVLLRDEVGAITKRTFELLKGNVWAKKRFVLDRADVEAAELVIRIDGGSASDGESVALIVEINGHPVEHRAQKGNRSHQGMVDDYWSGGWEIVPVPTEALREGTNEVILRDGGSTGWRLYIDNSLCPNRSEKSADGGKTWTSERLGLNDFCRGEYVIRLNLRRYAPKGTITSPAIDLAALGGEGPIAPRSTVDGLSIEARTKTPEGTDVQLQWRSGTTPAYRPDTWSAWDDFLDELEPTADHRFAQWRAILSTTRPRVTPELMDVTVKVKLNGEISDPLPAVRDLQNEHIMRGSHPFAYQLADEPRLDALRERWRLDHVVQSAKTEFEKILRLKRWTRQQWENGWDHGALQFVPPWDAMVVLELASRKLSLGMCTHYASTFVQCCLAVGLTARVVIISCHCVAEVWSNEYKKWVLMDPGCDFDDGRKGTRHFERYGIPMSALDLHRAHVNEDLNGVVECNDPERFGGTLQENISLYRQFCTTVRNNFMTSLLPEEPEHGAIAYTYDGHVWWRSEAMPLPQFSVTSRREGDFQWTLNQTEIYLQVGPELNTLEVLLDTVTPNFDTYLVQIDDGEWEEKAERFVWSTSPGTHTLRAKTRNAFGLEGIESAVTVEAGVGRKA